jgi:DNA-binding MarR family transcriptional regulator
MVIAETASNTRLMAFRSSVHENLQIQSTLIPLDILLLVMDNDGVRDVTIKLLLSGLSHSQTGVRYHLKRMISEGWLALSKGELDKRNTFVTLTTRSRIALAKVETDLSAAFQKDARLPTP